MSSTLAPRPLEAATLRLPEYLTAGQVAEALGVSAKSVYRWARQDATLPQLTIGGTVRFPRERLERWLRSREGQGAHSDTARSEKRPTRFREPVPCAAEVRANTGHGAGLAAP